jgi:hypothetical protein
LSVIGGTPLSHAFAGVGATPPDHQAAEDRPAQSLASAEPSLEAEERFPPKVADTA